MTQNKMVIIDDLTEEESTKVVNFLKEAIEIDALDIPIQDCISIASEIKFHAFEETNYIKNVCLHCTKKREDTIHQMVFS